jgi:hypothetical protein
LEIGAGEFAIAQDFREHSRSDYFAAVNRDNGAPAVWML